MWTTTSGRKSPISPSTTRALDDAVLDQAQPRVRLQIVAPAGGEIVDRHDLVAARQQHIDDGRADLARTAGDEHFHYPAASNPFREHRSVGGPGEQPGAVSLRRPPVSMSPDTRPARIVKQLVPQLEAQQAPNLARETPGGFEIGEHGFARSEMGAAARGGCGKCPARNPAARPRTIPSAAPESPSCRADRRSRRQHIGIGEL